MANLYSSIGQNAQKATHDTFNYGTPRVYPLVIVRNDEGDWTGYADSGSDFFKVLNYLQGRGVEIYGVGEVSGNVFTVLVNWEKMPKDAGEDDPDVATELGLFEDEVNALLGIGCNFEYGKIIGGNISYNC